MRILYDDGLKRNATALMCSQARFIEERTLRHPCDSGRDAKYRISVFPLTVHYRRHFPYGATLDCR